MRRQTNATWKEEVVKREIRQSDPVGQSGACPFGDLELGRLAGRQRDCQTPTIRQHLSGPGLTCYDEQLSYLNKSRLAEIVNFWPLPLHAANSALTGNLGEFIICGICVREQRTEQQRLIDQAEALEPQASWLLDRLRVEAGWRVADIGCGPVGILDLLSERVGAKGEVVGIEREQRFADLARREIENRGLKNVSIVESDALGPNETSEQFDLVHERLVLLNLPQRDQSTVVEQMVSRLKPGGLIALQEYDAVSLACYPEHPSWTILLEPTQPLFALMAEIAPRVARCIRSCGQRVSAPSR